VEIKIISKTEKARQSRSIVKNTLIIFFDFRGSIQDESVYTSYGLNEKFTVNVVLASRRSSAERATGFVGNAAGFFTVTASQRSLSRRFW
jgi:hypothetical protein